MKSSPRIVFATTCRGRIEHLRQTLPQNMMDNVSYANCKFVVVDYDSRDGLQEYLKTVMELNLHSGYLSVYTHLAPGPFHLSHAKNMAARCAILEGADIVVTLDADNYTGPGFAQFIADKFQEEEKWPGIFLCPNFPYIKSLPHGPERPDRGYAGRFAIRANDFIKMGGYDETFDTWHGEDVDMISRLTRLGYSMRHIDNYYLKTIPHGADVRFKEYPHAKQYEKWDEWQIIDSRDTTVVNYGKWGVGRVFKNYDFNTPIDLDPLPTRVFGIGMHKTGTTTLHHAFEILGFDSLHWGMGEAPRIWNEMQANGRSSTMEQWYAFSDLPFPLLYKQLDKAYPGSKFILTIRNEKDWLVSVAKLWDANFNPTRWIWDVYPFSHRIHKELYGQKHFNGRVMLERYRRHNAEVIEYFKDRPKDLLVIDIDAQAGWLPLCKFLVIPMPSVPYPFSNRTTPTHEYKELAQAGVSYCDTEAIVPSNEYTRGLLKDWQIVGDRVPVTGDVWIEESRQGSGIMRDTPGIGKTVSSLPTSPRLIVRERGREPVIVGQAKALATIPAWRDLSWWDVVVDVWNWKYREIVIFILAILLGILGGIKLEHLMRSK